MSRMRAGTRYSTIAVLFHWAVALLIFILLPLGIYMTAQPLSPRTIELYSWHKSLGITVLALAALRIAWRLLNPPPPLPAHMPALQKFASHAVHALLYLGMLAIPLTGWTGSSAAGFTVAPFGLFPLPNLVGKDKALNHLMFEIHELAAFTVAGLIVLHIAAALFHQFVQKDDLIARMSFFGTKRSLS